MIKLSSQEILVTGIPTNDIKLDPIQFRENKIILNFYMDE